MKIRRKLGIFVIAAIAIMCARTNVNAASSSDINVSYQGHVENIGWQASVSNDAMAGTSGKALRVEALKIKIDNPLPNMKIKYQMHVENIGWQAPVYDGALAGTTGRALRVEAMKIELVGAPAGYHVQYQVHVQNIGWMNYVQDGAIAGTTGKALRMEALRIRIVKDGPVKLSPLMCVDTPTANTAVKSNFNIQGWSLNESGVKAVNVYVDGQTVGNAAIGISRPDVAKVYPAYSEGSKSGFNYSVNINTLKPGSHTVKVESVGNDGVKVSQSVPITIQKASPLMCVDTPAANTVMKNDLNIEGWALNASNVKQVNILVDGKVIGQANYGGYRPDVAKVYPGYPSGNNSGFKYVLDFDSVTMGTHTLLVQALGTDGTKTDISISIVKNSNDANVKVKTIVVDPGHNYGGDDGAYKSYGNTTYSERDLNMQMALKVKSELEKRGFNVILTRQEGDRDKEDAHTSLQNRTNIANSANADLFISLHHDVSPNSTTVGVSTHYSTYKPGIDPNGVVTGNDPNGWYSEVNIDTTPSDAAIKSRDLAIKLVAGLSSSLGYNNLNAHDHNLFVTVNTNMPAVLIEEGFLSNQAEAQRCADQTQQTIKAQKIAQIIDEYFKTI